MVPTARLRWLTTGIEKTFLLEEMFLMLLNGMNRRNIEVRPGLNLEGLC
jgi:hypothetical protein